LLLKGVAAEKLQFLPEQQPLRLPVSETAWRRRY
jgi:hypothetical protein